MKASKHLGLSPVEYTKVSIGIEFLIRVVANRISLTIKIMRVMVITYFTLSICFFSAFLT